VVDLEVWGKVCNFVGEIGSLWHSDKQKKMGESRGEKSRVGEIEDGRLKLGDRRLT